MAWWAIIREWSLKFHVNPLAFNFYLITARVYRLRSHRERWKRACSFETVHDTKGIFIVCSVKISDTVSLHMEENGSMRLRRRCKPTRWGHQQIGYYQGQRKEAGTRIGPKLLPGLWKKKSRNSAILPGNAPLSSLLPSFNHFSPSLPLISSPHPTLPQSPYQKGMRDKGNIWQSATLPTSHPSSINASLLSHPRLPPLRLVYAPPCFL